MIDKNQYLCELSGHPMARFWRVDFANLTEPERVFAAIWELESEVNNGGFHQFYFNSTGDIAYFTPDALAKIGAKNVAQLVSEANSLFPNRCPAREQMLRRQQLQAIGETATNALENLDDQFYQYPDNLTDLLYDYVIAHRDEIAGT
jgi:hypothetical protein